MNTSTIRETCPSVEATLVRLWTDQRAALLRRCRHFLRHSEADAEDAFGRATLAMMQSARSQAELRCPAAWMGEIIRNACIDVHRENARRREEALRAGDMGDDAPSELRHDDRYLDPERICMQRETAEALWSAVDALPPHLRAPLLLRAEEGMSYSAMAALLLDSEDNLRKRVQVARRAVAESLDRHLSDAEPPPREDGSRMGRSEDAELLVAPAPLPIRHFLPVARNADGPSLFVPLPSPLPRHAARRAERLHRYVEKHPTGWRKRLMLADMLFGAGRLAEAVGHYRAIVARRPGAFQAWMRLSNALQCAGRDEEAARVLERLEDASRSPEVGLHFRGLASIVRGLFDAAEQCFLRASASGEYAPALSALAALHAHRARPTDALDTAQRALACDPHDLQALLVAHDASRLAGQTARAEDYLARALAVQADCVPALLREFDAARLSAAPRRASRALQKLRKAAPDLPEVKRRVALAQASKMKPPPPRALRREKDARARDGEGVCHDALTP